MRFFLSFLYALAVCAAYCLAFIGFIYFFGIFFSIEIAAFCAIAAEVGLLIINIIAFVEGESK